MSWDDVRYRVVEASPFVKEATRLGQLEIDTEYPRIKKKAEQASRGPVDPAKEREDLAKAIMKAQIDFEQATADYNATKRTAAIANRLMYWSPVGGVVLLPLALFNLYVPMLVIGVIIVALVTTGYHLRPAEIRGDRSREIDARHKLNFLYEVKVEQYGNDKQLTA